MVNESAIIYGIENKILNGYLTDVLNDEPMKKQHPFIRYNNIYLTPHIGSRTFQSVERQGLMAVKNLVNKLTIWIDFKKSKE